MRTSQFEHDGRLLALQRQETQQLSLKFGGPVARLVSERNTIMRITQAASTVKSALGEILDEASQCDRAEDAARLLTEHNKIVRDATGVDAHHKK